MRKASRHGLPYVKTELSVAQALARVARVHKRQPLIAKWLVLSSVGRALFCFDREGKYIKLQYGADWKLGGARTLPFLLEKSRLVHQEQNERNYHVFYQLCGGVSVRSR